MMMAVPEVVLVASELMTGKAFSTSADTNVEHNDEHGSLAQLLVVLQQNTPFLYP